jgi:hypothetical protein
LNDQIKEDEMVRICSTNVGKPEGMRPLKRPRCRWVDSNKVDHREIGSDGIDWIDMAQDRDKLRALVNMVMSLQAPYDVGKFLSRCAIGSSQTVPKQQRIYFNKHTCFTPFFYYKGAIIPWKES